MLKKLNDVNMYMDFINEINNELEKSIDECKIIFYIYLFLGVNVLILVLR